MAVYIDPYRQSAGAGYAKVISDLIGGIQDRQQQEEAARNAVMAKQFMSLPPDVQAQYYSQLPDGVREMFLNPNSLPAHTPTAEEQVKLMRDQDALKTYPSLPQSVHQAGAYQTTIGTAMPPEMVKGQYQNDILSHPDQFAPQMQTAVGVEQKVLPTGGEKLTVGEQTRHNQVEELQTGRLRAAQAGEANAATSNQYAQAQEHTAKAKAASMYLPDADTGAPNPAVQNAINAVRSGVKAGIGVDAMMKRIKDPNLSKAVSAEMTKPQNKDIATSLPPLTTKGQNALTEIAPAEQNVDEIIKALEPFKDDNKHGLRWAHLKYTLGFGSDPSTLDSKISQFNLAGIEAQMPFASKSRAYQYIQDIGRHRFHTEKDTFETMYEKALNIKHNFQLMRDAINRYERQGVTGGDLSGAPSVPQSPSGVIVYDNNGNRVQ